MLNTLYVVQIQVQSLCMCHSPDSHARNIEADRNSWCTNSWTLLCHVSNVFIFHHILLYLMFIVAVYTLKGACFSQALVSKSEHKATGVSSSTVLLPIFFGSSSGVNVAKLIHKMHIGIFFLGKRHVCSYFSLHTYYSTK